MSARTCGFCEYFDRHHGDCLNSLAPRFQTEATWTCVAWEADSGALMALRDSALGGGEKPKPEATPPLPSLVK